MPRRCNDDDTPQPSEGSSPFINDGRSAITFNSKTGEYHVRLDPNQDIPLHSLIPAAVAKLEDTDSLSLDPLANYIDPEHLEGLFEHQRRHQTESITVSFSYLDYRVTVESPTMVTLEP